MSTGGEEVGGRCARIGDDVEALAGHVAGLAPPSWRGPAATALQEALRRPVVMLDDAAAALRAAARTVRRLGPP